ncbi:hypothetical protein BGY98DRAFT_1167947 [Russula aff. rugulosa BPL654]|nr:hypothetical protein BGY98DRAFT_1167947 [Russula aff. rugulosa BPL654]
MPASPTNTSTTTSTTKPLPAASFYNFSLSTSPNATTIKKCSHTPEALVKKQMKIFHKQWAGLGLSLDLALAQGFDTITIYGHFVNLYHTVRVWMSTRIMPKIGHWKTAVYRYGTSSVAFGITIRQTPPPKTSQTCTTGIVKRHCSSLHDLINIISTNINDIGTKKVATHNPARPQQQPFMIRISTDKETSIKEAQEVVNKIQVFTDSLVTNDKVDAAVILTRSGNDHRILHYHLGKASEYTIYDTELVGLSMGMHLIKTEKKVRHSTMLDVDNQAAINAIQNELSTPNHYIAKNVLQTAQ